jgi:U3 small nucleolar RNA-associated protein 25
VFHQDRFRAEFGPEEGEEDLADGEQHDPSKPDDWNRTFAGNIDDCFRVGLALTNKSVKLFTPFYGSDIIVASPLGLRMIVGSDGHVP